MPKMPMCITASEVKAFLRKVVHPCLSSEKEGIYIGVRECEKVECDNDKNADAIVIDGVGVFAEKRRPSHDLPSRYGKATLFVSIRIGDSQLP
jgi:hypothetical protein